MKKLIKLEVTVQITYETGYYRKAIQLAKDTVAYTSVSRGEKDGIGYKMWEANVKKVKYIK